MPSSSGQPNSRGHRNNDKQMVNPPSMAQLQATPTDKANGQVNPEATHNILLMNPNENASGSDNSNRVRAQVATPEAFGEERRVQADDGQDEEDFFLDEDNIGD